MSNSLLQEFSEEAIDLLSDAEDSLLEMEKNGFSEESYNSIFRAFHSLKGSSGMMGLSDIQKHMHLCEDYFQSLKETPEVLVNQIDYFLDSIDHTKKLLNGENVQFIYNSSEQKSNALKKQESKGNEDPSVKEELIINSYSVDVIGKSFLESPLYLKLEKNLIINHVPNLNEYFKNGLYFGSHAIIVSEDSINEFRERSLKSKDELTYLVYCPKNDFSIKTKGFLLHDEIGNSELKSLFELTKYHMKTMAIMDKAMKLLYYQYVDLDRYLKEKGRESIRKTLKSEMSYLMEARKKVFEI